MYMISYFDLKSYDVLMFQQKNRFRLQDFPFGMAVHRRMARTSSHDPNSVLRDVRMQQRCELSTLAALVICPKLCQLFFWGW